MTTLKGIFPETKTIKGKNFIHENIRNLRRLEHFNAHKEIDEIEKLKTCNRRKIINNSYSSHNHNALSKMGYNFQGKRQVAKDTNMTVNNEGKQPQEICKKSSVPMLKKSNIHTKRVTCTSNNPLNKQTKKEQKAFLLKSTQKFHQKTSSDPSLSYKITEETMDNIRVKSQGIQTLDTGDIDYLYSEGVIKYPRKKNVNCSEGADNNNGNKDTDTSARHVRNEPSDHGDVQVLEDKSQNKNDIKNAKLLSTKEEIDFIKLNKERISSVNKTVTQTDTNGAIPNHRIGVIPKYIKNRKEIQEKAEKMKTEEQDPNCPSGHVPLPASERKETLRMLRKNYQDYVNELNTMPIKVDTLRAQRRKIEIEKQLNKLEEGIKVFSRPKVYVKMDA